MSEMKNEGERERLDAIFEELAMEERGEVPLPSERLEAERRAKLTDEERARLKAEKAAEGDYSTINGNIQGYIHDDVFKTRRERFLALAFVRLYSDFKQMKTEFEIYKTFTVNVSTRLDRAVKTAKEQDNHHYYKTFADYVAGLLEKM